MMRTVARAKRKIRILHHLPTIITLICVAGLTVVTSHTVLSFNRVHDARELLVWYGIAWGIFVMAVAIIHFVPFRTAIVIIVLGGLALGLVSLLKPPQTSTDSARYAWDGIVAKSGRSPYNYVPSDSKLTQLRPDWLFPAVLHPEGNYPNAPLRCPGIEPTLTKDNGTGIPLCTEINRPQVHTIYPALAEMYFLLIEVISPPGGNYLPLQIAGLILSTGVTALLLWGLWWHQLNPRWAALWAWCPLVASEAVNNAHVDILGAFLALGAVLLIAGKRYFLGGLGIGAAAAAKLIPFVLLPALIRRRPLRVISGAIGAFATLYLPYVWASGTDIIGYLPGYLKEEGYRGGDPGSRFALVRMVVPNDWAVVAGAVVLAITALIVLWRVNPDRPWATVATMVGMALLVTTPSYPWYSLLLIPFVAMAGRWEWLLVAAAPSALYLSISAGGHGWALPLSVAKLGFGTAGIIVVVVTLLRAYLPRQSLHNKRRKS